ncbi:MAG: S8 family serine peptidase, partial [Candidatus Thorarchaeota archaeon]
MQRKLVSALLLTCLVLSSVPVLFYLSSVDDQQTVIPETTPLNFGALTELYGEQIPVVAKFENGLTSSMIDIILGMGIEFSLGNPTTSHIGPYYLLQGSSTSLANLVDLNIIDEIAAQSHLRFIESPRDVSIPEINADDVWKEVDDLGLNITGEGILIADLDTGVDWRHPDLWFADGGNFEWLDSGAANGVFDNTTDGVDLDDDGSIATDEVLYAIDLSADGIFNVTTEWLWADNVTQNGIPDIGEPFFIVNDTSGDGYLDLGEALIMLGTPKTKYIFEKDGNPSPTVQSWVRGVNLTASTHTDDSSYGGGHGTAVAGILLGGTPELRTYVGTAPSAELMMLRVIGDQFTWLSIEEALVIANNTGADVILTEIGSWTYQYLDGSSLAEQIIDELVADGIPVISPSGNLGGKDKHAMATVPAYTGHVFEFTIPPPDGVYVTEDIANVYITVLTVNSTDFSNSNFTLIMDQTSFALPPAVFNLNPGVGYLNFFAEPPTPNYVVESFISISNRSTSMLGIWIHDVLPTTVAPPWHQLQVSIPDPATIHTYISDDQSSWTGGCVWMTDIVNEYQICWPSTADSAVSVASYHTRNLLAGTIGDIASFSSRGPRIDGVLKQGVAAPGGYDVFSDYADGSHWSTWYNAYGSLSFDQRFGSYRLFSGTSASGPHVAGCAALLLQTNSTIGNQFKSIVESTAVVDAFTGGTPNYDWGYGKLDCYGALMNIQPIPDTEGPVLGSLSQIPSTPNSTESVNIDIGVSDVSGVDTVILSYYNGTTWTNVTMTWSGSGYEGLIPALPNGTIVSYRIYANDSIGNWAVSGTFGYTVQDSTTTTTTTT